MINNIAPLIVQTPVQTPVDGVIATPFQAAAAWIDDVVTWRYIFGN